MWEHCGVVHDELRLKSGLDKICSLKESLVALDVRPDSEGYEDLMLAFDLDGSIFSAEATMLSALKRKESRGAHQRDDFPETNPEEALNYRVKANTDGSLIIFKENLPVMRDDLKMILEKTQEIKNFEGKLIE